MRRVIIALITLMVISVGFLSGCTENGNVNEERESLLFVITDTGYESEDYVYVDIQNIDSEQGEFYVEYTFTLVDSDMLGEHYGEGGQTDDWDSDNEGVEHDFRVIQVGIISPHETKRARCPISRRSGYETVSWDYEVVPPYKTQ